MLLHFTSSRIFGFSKYTACIANNIQRMLRKLREKYLNFSLITMLLIKYLVNIMMFPNKKMALFKNKRCILILIYYRIIVSVMILCAPTLMLAHKYTKCMQFT